jgi:Maltose operon periplasmic protein precursor (MalM)
MISIHRLCALGVVALAWISPRTLAGTLMTDPELFTYSPLPTEGSVRVRIDSNSPHFVFRSGDSAYAAFRLPDTHGAYLVDIIAPLEPPTHPAQSRVFYPAMALLSDNFIVTRASDGAAWHFDLPELGLTTVPAYRLTVEIPDGGPERYLVVYTPRDPTTSALPGASASGSIIVNVSPVPAE